MDRGPVREIRNIVNDSGNPGYVNRIMVGTATTGQVRIEWVAARYGQIIPVNWSQVQVNQFLDAFMPLRYQVAEAQNLIVKQAVEMDFEWLFLLEHDVIVPRDCFIRINDWMMKGTHPVVSGLYFTRSVPGEPLIFRGRGTSYHGDWKIGDQVYADGVPTGALLIHCSILRAMWKESEEYVLGSHVARRVFETPRRSWSPPDSDEYHMTTGTSDLDWCTRVMREDFLRKAGWGSYVDSLEDERYPFLVDTDFFCYHINPDGIQYPIASDLQKWLPEETDGQ